MSTKTLVHRLTPTSAAVILLFLYNDWVLAPVLNPALSTRASLISEISARTQPYHWLFQSLDIAAGIMTLVLLPCLLRLLKNQPGLWKWLLFAGIALIGADSIIDAMLPISCAPSIDIHCSLTGTHSLVTEAHLAESTLIGIVTFAAPILWWFREQKRRPLLAQASALFVVLQAGVGLGIVLAHHNETAVVGLLQRFYQLAIGAWITLIMVSSIRATQRHRASRREMAVPFVAEAES